MTIRPRPDRRKASGALRAARGAGGVALLALLTACAGGRQALPGAPRQLPADSLALLEAALERAKPAYRTQAEAIRAGVYAEGKLARERKREEAARAAVAQTPGEPGGSAVAGDPAATPPGNVGPAGPGTTPPGTRGAPAPTGAPPDPGATERPAADARFVIQIGAFPEPALALGAAERASLRFPGTEPVIEWAGGVYRAAIGGWTSREGAAARLPAVREAYPGAWIRERERP